MASQFTYKAIAEDGRRLSGTINAAGASSVEEFLREQHLLPLVIEPVKARRAVTRCSASCGVLTTKT
jgi:type II secretory pathway component PulF